MSTERDTTDEMPENLVDISAEFERRKRKKKVLTGSEIRILGGALPRMVDQAEVRLLDDNVYQRGGILVRLVRNGPVTVPGIRRDQGALSIVMCEPAYLTDRLTHLADWIKFDARLGDWKSVDCPGAVATTLLARNGHWKLPHLVGIVLAPTLRPDGSILEAQGYDAETGLYVDLGGVEFPGIPENPTRDEARAALELLEELVRDFPFVDRSDRSTALAAVLTGLVRKSLTSAPLFGFDAPKYRSGKTLLCLLVSLLATGHEAASVAFTGDPDEEKKRLMALLLAGDPVIMFDNITGAFGGDAISAALTGSSYQDRILGVSEVRTVPTSATFVANGNNLSFAADISTRVVVCRIDPETERPEERTFDSDLREEVPRRRPELVAAALTVLRAWHVAGMPDQGLPQWGGFEDWSRWIRGALVWLGHEDPAVGRRKVEAADPVRQELRALLATWRGAMGEAKVTTADLIKTSGYSTPEAVALREALVQVAGTPHGDISARKIGNYLNKHYDRIEGGLKLVKAGEVRAGYAAWRVVEKEGV